MLVCWRQEDSLASSEAIKEWTSTQREREAEAPSDPSVLEDAQRKLSAVHALALEVMMGSSLVIILSVHNCHKLVTIRSATSLGLCGV